MPSFDIVSQIDMQEIDNAVNQARKEVIQRFDLKKTKTEIEYDKTQISILSDDEFFVRQVLDVLQSKLVRRQVPLKALKFGEPKPAAGGRSKLEIAMQQGITDEQARQLVKMIKDLKMKVQTQIMGDQLRITGKKKDELQDVIAMIKNAELSYNVQFVNYRD
jgi:cyclic-di-GMP-binding protein